MTAECQRLMIGEMAGQIPSSEQWAEAVGDKEPDLFEFGHYYWLKDRELTKARREAAPVG